MGICCCCTTTVYESRVPYPLRLRRTSPKSHTIDTRHINNARGKSNSPRGRCRKCNIAPHSHDITHVCQVHAAGKYMYAHIIYMRCLLKMCEKTRRRNAHAVDRSRLTHHSLEFRTAVNSTNERRRRLTPFVAGGLMCR